MNKLKGNYQLNNIRNFNFNWFCILFEAIYKTLINARMQRREFCGLDLVKAGRWIEMVGEEECLIEAINADE